ncbi:MAG: translation elongation factor 4 [Candidatus Melainabacteria bacterium]|nr:translation elongation factor 4 [Candidatus Melainabacteria bacterium]
MSKDSKTRVFSIIAHIDHGKSTLADRLLEATGTISQRDMQAQLMDTMDIERERGITIKLNMARMEHKGYTLNLIDTPGHVDFTYEVSRSLAACEGALLVVDASQGVEAQTLANVYLAIENDLEIIPVLNKVDLPSADVERVKQEIEDIVGIDCSDAVEVSAKTGLNIDQLLDAIIERIPPAEHDLGKPLKALVFDSYYDSYLGIVAYARILEGKVSRLEEIEFMQAKTKYQVTELGYRNPNKIEAESLEAGDVGYIACSIKEIQSIVGDTITKTSNPTAEPVPGYKAAMPVVFCGLYPVDTKDYEDLKEALEKLKLNDSSITFEPESSRALGSGYRCGFLGLLHMEVAQDRLEREYGLNLITTAPSVSYKVHMIKGEVIEIDNPSNLPDPTHIDFIEEPYVTLNVMLPQDYVGAIMELCQERRGNFIDMKHLNVGSAASRTKLHYEIPLSEIVTDFFDQLKSRSKGYATMDYEVADYKKNKLVKMDILLNGEKVDALSTIVFHESAHTVGSRLAKKLKEVIPPHLFEVPIQAAIGGKIVARETVRAQRKDVLAKCYGGDISRKKKLLEKQKKGKKRMKNVGSVELPQEAFMAVLKLD